jgi:hypothetical protein
LDEAAAYVWSVEQGAPDEARYNKAMPILHAASENAITPDDVSEFDELQTKIVTDDILKMTSLMQHVETLIYAGTEQHTDRKGETREIPIRPDAVAKLGHLYIAAANVRANRAGLATTISETRATIDKREAGVNVHLLLQDEEATRAAHILTAKMFAPKGEK